MLWAKYVWELLETLVHCYPLLISSSALFSSFLEAQKKSQRLWRCYGSIIWMPPYAPGVSSMPLCRRRSHLLFLSVTKESSYFTCEAEGKACLPHRALCLSTRCLCGPQVINTCPSNFHQGNIKTFENQKSQCFLTSLSGVKMRYQKPRQLPNSHTLGS